MQEPIKTPPGGCGGSRGLCTNGSDGSSSGGRGKSGNGGGGGGLGGVGMRRGDLDLFLFVFFEVVDEDEVADDGFESSLATTSFFFLSLFLSTFE